MPRGRNLKDAKSCRRRQGFVYSPSANEWSGAVDADGVNRPRQYRGAFLADVGDQFATCQMNGTERYAPSPEAAVIVSSC